MKLTHAILILCLVACGAAATTWSETELTDPMTKDKVSAHEIMSYGSYIYNWPSKYDLVFWPLIDEHWICMNEMNGYAAFNDDFEKLPRTERKKLAAWLDENYDPTSPPKTHEEKLAWLEKVYGQRDMDDEFWCRFYRLMAHMHGANESKGLEYVKKAMPLLTRQLEANPKGVDRIELLFLMGEYNRRLGNKEKAEDLFAQVKSAPYKDEDGEEQVGHPYFLELVHDCELVMKEATDKRDETDKANDRPGRSQ